jgi:hypothetical protein
MANPDSQAGSQPTGGPSQPPSSPDETAVGPSSGAPDIIVFYCPSGHKLNAPSRLQGNPGQCPHCGEKFRIPSYEEDQVEEAVEEVEEVEEDLAAPGDRTAASLADIEDIEDFPETHEEIEELQDEIVDIDVEADIEDFPIAEQAVAASSSLPGHALARLFTQLWDRHGTDGDIDLYLAEGELLSPEFFSPQLSQATHGVFAERVEDGTYNVISIPWESVKKAVVRKVDRLPDGLFS